MTIILFLSCVAAFLIPTGLALVDSMHFFQLNSYRFSTHTKWISENFNKYLPHYLFSVILLIVSLFSYRADIKMGIVAMLFIVAAIIERPKKAKKPLVYTPRVKRMFITTAIIFAAVIAGTSVPLFRTHHESVAVLIVVCLYVLSPFWALVSNFINVPIEKAVNRHYIRDAKRLLAACPDLRIIGITGSYGKTSVKYYLNTLLRAKYNVLMTPESYNTPMGVVKTIRSSLRATHEIFICEMGAKWVGDIKELCDIVHPQHGIITSIGPQHLESFKTLDAVKKTKFELADALPENGMLFLNNDDENILAHGCNRPFVSYGIKNKSDYTASDISVSERGTTFTVTGPDGESESFSTRLVGRHNVLNITGAIAAANCFGIPLSQLKGQVRRLECVPHRLELKNKSGLTLIDDAYNSNPSGTKAALEALSLFDGFKILVTPGMVELGEKQEELNREFGRNAASTCDHVVLVGKKQAVPIKAGLLDEGFPEKKIFVADTIEEALTHVYALSSGGQKKVVLLENDLPDNY